MDAMGSKTRARQAMERAGVPFVPGTSHGLESLAEAEEAAARIGYPVMLKAAAGGGGKGMRRVESPDEIDDAFGAAAGISTPRARPRRRWTRRARADCTSSKSSG